MAKPKRKYESDILGVLYRAAQGAERAGVMSKTTDPYNHGQECKALGIPYFAWCCQACAERAGAGFSAVASFPAGGWCQAGKHRVVGETKWLLIDPDAVTPWPLRSIECNDVTLHIGDEVMDAYQAAMERFNEQSATIQAVIDREYRAGTAMTPEWFAECVSLVLDI